MTLKFDYEELETRDRLNRKKDRRTQEQTKTRKSIVTEREWRTDAVRQWHQQANQLARQLEMASPISFRSTDVQFPLAALKRSEGAATASDSIFRTILGQGSEASVRRIAQRELWATFPTDEQPRELIVCHKSSSRPLLDGILADSCWQEANEFLLTSEQDIENGEPDPTATLVMLSYDDDYLYIGMSVPRMEGTPTDPPQTKGRTRDADLSRFDRVALCLDVDRGYSTWYELEIDQRGWTRDKCWEDSRWNPQWFVAANGEESHWRIEAAVAWSDLVPNRPSPNQIWNVAVRRIIPTVGTQAWVHPDSSSIKPQSFGLLRFE
ncbi:MAG: hypothetical protein FJ267_09320 [Planctomycetes bacterium]|nr:hypothetical protein [Planctomycetota bacterium]